MTAWCHTKIPGAQEVEIKRIAVQGYPRQKVITIPSQQTGMVVYIYKPNYAGRIARKMESKVGHKEDTIPYPKYN
jgi:hypothetical protein